ncbi:MAG: LacI family DNA-binding transcriptional regulator [Sphingopyxis sp.]
MTRATISDVANAAGVSMKSVSRVINSEPNVSAKLRKKVEDAIAALGYVPELAARSLAGGRAFTLAVLFDNPSPNYTIKIQAGAYRACREHGYHLLIETIDSTRDDVGVQMQSILRTSRVDGFIVTPPLTECVAVLDMLEQHDMPYVRVAPVSHPGRSAAITIDDASAAREVARYLWQLGHRRVAIVNGPAEHGAAITRRIGFLDEIYKLGGDTVIEAYGGFAFDIGIAAGRELMSLPNPPTAIFATNDDSAAGVMSTIAEMGLKVPADVSVVGFDDSWIAKSVWPYLTTIFQPINDMAYSAANALIKRDEPLMQTALDYALVVRNSAAQPRGA